jgi:trans-aconitate 2-methyltransferase
VQWDPSQYLEFADERLRPFIELVNRVGATDPATVVDLGCGPGNATALLAERWPSANIVGIDNSEEMIDRARAIEIEGRLSFRLGSANALSFEQPIDVLVSNATLQWVPGHLEFFAGYIDALSAGGWFAFQIPGMHTSRSHMAQYELANDPRWVDRLAPLTRANSIEASERYLEHLSSLGCTVDLWETTYFQVLQGPDAVLEWTKGSSLRPFMNELQGAEREAFVDEYAAMMREAYPEGSNGTVFPFRRVFVVAHREG